MTESTKAKASVYPLLPSTSSLICKITTQPQPALKSCEQQPQPKRPLAWQVAPNLLISFKYAWAGVRYAFITQRNFRIHTVIGVLAISLGVFLGITAVKMAVIVLTSALVMVLELLNTAIESVVDLTVEKSYHELAKIAKDCAAGAVLVSALAAVLVASFVLLPPLFALILSVFSRR
ncbi:MAG: diacylglycerol kinase [Xenococcaceae cyanobacterium]